MRKIFTLIIAVLLFFNLTSKRIFAEENFDVSYDTTYTVNESGKTHVLFKINLTNRTSQYYASSYKINLGFKNIENVTASDAEGQINPKSIKTDYGFDIETDFNQKVVGMNKVYTLNLSLDTYDVASKQGYIWEINIPGIEDQTKFTSFNTHVKVPKSFGQPVYTKPYQQTNAMDFTKEDLGKSGISLGFGEKQIYSFTLKYHLKNSRLVPVNTEIALPSSTNYQNIYIDDISPKPSNVIADKDGNWLAQYKLSPSKEMDIVVKGKAEVFLFPKKETITDKEYINLLQEKKYWEVSDKKIKKLANDLKTPFAIYEYVVKNLKYDFSRITSNKPRLGAKNVINNPSSSVCLEFTDLFIALARAANIPAREVDGFAYTKNEKQRPLSLLKDVLHAWPEYYDKDLQTWVMVDPTWGNTTNGIDYFNVFDFDHLALVIKGEDSEYPVPAGGYKLSGNNSTKDIEVEFSKEEPNVSQNFHISSDFPNSYPSGLPINGALTIKNAGSIALSSQEILINTNSLFPKTRVIPFKTIPPYGYKIIPISFDKTPILTKREATFTITLNGKTITQNIKIYPIFVSVWGLLGGVFFAAVFTIILLFIARRSWNIYLFRRKE